LINTNATSLTQRAIYELENLYRGFAGIYNDHYSSTTRTPNRTAATGWLAGSASETCPPSSIRISAAQLH
jgi:hypothetical protein